MIMPIRTAIAGNPDINRVLYPTPYREAMLHLVRRMATAGPSEFWDLRQEAAALLAGDAPDVLPSLTPREADALACLGVHKPRTTTWVAVELVVSDSWARRLLSRLASKGYVRRTNGHVGGGWLAVHRQSELEKVA